MNLPDGRRGQLTAVGLLLIVLIILTQFVVLPLRDNYRAMNEDIVDMQADISRYQNLIAQAPKLQALAEKVARTRPLRPLVLPGESESLAAANLQQRLQDLAKQNDVRVLSLRIRPAQADGPLERVTVEARMQSDIDGLRGLLFALESQTPYLFVDTFSLRTRPARRRGARPAGNLDVRLELFAMRVTDARAGTAGAL